MTVQPDGMPLPPVGNVVMEADFTKVPVADTLSIQLYKQSSALISVAIILI